MTEIPRVLIAEENEQVASVLEIQVRNAGYDTRVSTPDAAIAALDEYRPHIVFVGSTREEMTAYATCRAIRERSPVAIVGLAGRFPYDIPGWITSKADAWMPKPWNPRAIPVVLSALLDKITGALNDYVN